MKTTALLTQREAVTAPDRAGAVGYAVGSMYFTQNQTQQPDGRTRSRVAQLLLQRGSATASELSGTLGLSIPAIRRHLDAMLAEDLVEVRDRPSRGPRGRGRPAKVFSLTDAAREAFPHTYNDLATAALRWIAQHDGPAAVSAFATAQVAGLEERCWAAMAEAVPDPVARATALAGALTAEGYAAGASTIASGGQLCQHHCPVAQVAAEFPQLCEAETQVISRLVGTHVQRLATIANGNRVCTTHIPGPYRLVEVTDRSDSATSDDAVLRPGAVADRTVRTAR